MGKTAKLKITSRTKGSKGAMNRLRKEGWIPGSISEKGKNAVSISMKKDEFRKAFHAHGMSGIYTLQGDEKEKFTAMIREIQHLPGSEEFLHVTFQSVFLNEETTADVPLHIIGRDELQHHKHELIQQLETVHLKGLPGDFPPSVEIDVSSMQPGDQVTAGELKLPKGIVCLTDPNQMVLSVPHPRLKDEAEEETEGTLGQETEKPAETSEEK